MKILVSFLFVFVLGSYTSYASYKGNTGKKIDEDEIIKACEDSIYYDDDKFVRAQVWMDIPKDSALSANCLSLLQEQCNEVILHKVSSRLESLSFNDKQEPDNHLWIRTVPEIPQFIVTKNSNVCLIRAEKGISMMVEANKEKLFSDFCEIREHIQKSSRVFLNEEEKTVDFGGDVLFFGTYKTENGQEWEEIKKAVEEDEQKAFLHLIFKSCDRIIKSQEKNIKELEARIVELQDLIVSREPEKVKVVYEERRIRKINDHVKINEDVFRRRLEEMFEKK